MDRSAIYDNLEDVTLLVGNDAEEKAMPVDEVKRILGVNNDHTISSYQNISTIGLGGLGAVFSATEPVLNREIALKILRPAYRNQPKNIDGFIREARITAQIDHPNIVPVHHLGVFDDVGAYFTMKKVAGENLRQVLRKLADKDPVYCRKYTPRRLLEIFLAACNGVSFAHSKGIIHRDLKPANIMLGDYGEVLVMDWGLARYRAEDDTAEVGQKIDLDTELSHQLDGNYTLNSRAISGTPAYMSPEQISKEPLDVRSDIYSLGGILYSILTCKPSPYPEDASVDQILQLAVNGNFPPPRKRTRKRKIPRELEAICLKAMSRRKQDRYQSVSDLSQDIRNYLDSYPVSAYSPPPFYRILKWGQRHPAIPLTLVFAALAVFAALGVSQLATREQIRAMLLPANQNILFGDLSYTRALSAWSMLEEKRSKADATPEQIEQLSGRFQLLQAEFENFYDSAQELLSQVEILGAESEDVSEDLTEIYRKRLHFYQLTGDLPQLRNYAARLQKLNKSAFQYILLEDELSGGRLKAILADQSQVKITTSVPGIRITCQELDAEENILSPPRELGITPLVITLPGGNYLLSAWQDGEAGIRMPVQLTSVRENLVHLEIPKSIPPDYIYIPSGPAPGRPQMILNPFFIGRFEVTMEEYIAFWKTLPENTKKKYLARRILDPESGEYVPCWDANGEIRMPLSGRMPVSGIPVEAARDFCRWKGEKLHLAGRLPTEEEWEKAARGMDGRMYIWGNEFLPEGALTLESPELEHYSDGAPVGSFPQDRSIYGVQDMAGNVREFVEATNAEFPGGLTPVKGGSFRTDRYLARCEQMSYSDHNDSDVGFRCLLEVPDQAVRNQE